MTQTVIMAFIGDLFPRRLAEPQAVASGISRYSASMDLRTAPAEIREVVRAAGEWQGQIKPKAGLFRAAPPAAGEAEFLQAAERAYRRFA